MDWEGGSLWDMGWQAPGSGLLSHDTYLLKDLMCDTEWFPGFLQFCSLFFFFTCFCPWNVEQFPLWELFLLIGNQLQSYYTTHSRWSLWISNFIDNQSTSTSSLLAKNLIGPGSNQRYMTNLLHETSLSKEPYQDIQVAWETSKLQVGKSVCSEPHAFTVSPTILSQVLYNGFECGSSRCGAHPSTMETSLYFLQ